jgi:hypothetical protein
LNNGRFSAKKLGVDLNVKMKNRKNSGATTPGAAHEHRQDVVRPTDCAFCHGRWVWLSGGANYVDGVWFLSVFGTTPDVAR